MTTSSRMRAVLEHAGRPAGKRPPRAEAHSPATAEINYPPLHRYKGHDPLADFEILSIDHSMAAACTVQTRLRLADDEPTRGWLRWIREGEDGYPKPDPWTGQRRLCIWRPFAVFAATALLAPPEPGAP